MSWGDRMNHYYILDCEPDWEVTVSFELHDFGIDHYLAMESRTITSRHTNRMTGIEVPMLPGIIFVRGDITELFNLRFKIRHIEGIWVSRSGNGIPVYLPQNDLERFRSEVDNYLTACRASIENGQKPPEKPPAIVINMGDLKDPKVKAQVMQKMFGIVEREAA